MTELFDEHSRRLHGVDDGTAEEILQYWESPDVDFEKDVIVAEGSDGSIVGYGDVGEAADARLARRTGTRPRAAARVARGDWSRSPPRRSPARASSAFVDEKDTGLRGVYEERGYQVIRHSYRMEIDLGDLPADASPPEGVAIRTMREGEEEPVYEVHEQSFEDAWMHQREPFEQWQHWFVKDPSFDPSLWFVAEADGEIAGVAICNTSGERARPGLGAGARRPSLPYRRRGIGEALLRHAFAEFERRGFERVGLGVDAESPTGAVALYERAGMHVARTSLQLEKVS